MHFILFAFLLLISRMNAFNLNSEGISNIANFHSILQGNGSNSIVGKTFNWSATNGGVGYYIESNLTIWVVVPGVGVVQETFGTGCYTIVDIKKKRIKYNLECAGGGSFELVENATTYNWNNLQFGNGTGCAVVNGFGYDQEVVGYSTLQAIPGSSVNHVTYVGDAVDSNACGRLFGAGIALARDVLDFFYFAQPYNLFNPQFNVWFCANVNGLLSYDHRTLRVINESDRAWVDALEQLPPQCFTNTTPFCETVYFPGSPCDQIVNPPANCPTAAPTAAGKRSINNLDD